MGGRVLTHVKKQAESLTGGVRSIERKVTIVAGNWRKSSFSFSNGGCIEVTDWRKPRRSYGGGNCVEIADWRKSGRSESSNCVEAADWRSPARSMADGNCVEVASGVAVRDTKDREGPVLKFSADGWRAFLGTLQGPSR